MSTFRLTAVVIVVEQRWNFHRTCAPTRTIPNRAAVQHMACAPPVVATCKRPRHSNNTSASKSDFCCCAAKLREPPLLPDCSRIQVSTKYSVCHTFGLSNSNSMVLIFSAALAVCGRRAVQDAGMTNAWAQPSVAIAKAQAVFMVERECSWQNILNCVRECLLAG